MAAKRLGNTEEAGPASHLFYQQINSARRGAASCAAHSHPRTRASLRPFCVHSAATASRLLTIGRLTTTEQPKLKASPVGRAHMCELRSKRSRAVFLRKNGQEASRASWQGQFRSIHSANPNRNPAYLVERSGFQRLFVVGRDHLKHGWRH